MAAPRNTWTLLRSTFRPSSSPYLRQFLHRTQKRTIAGVGDAPAITREAEKTGFAKLWNSNVGPKTVHFWAPIMKWGLVLAGVADFQRTPDQISLSQNIALMCTGAIWTRWCFVIIPRNLFLATVNFFVFLTGAYQTSRIVRWRRSQDGLSTTAEIEKLAKEEVHLAEDAVKNAAARAEAAVKR